jgi:hypothetical protein
VVSVNLGALLRTGHTCARVQLELANCDQPGLARALDGYNNTLSFLGGMLDETTGHELLALCPPIEREGTVATVGLAYAGLAGWIQGLLSGSQFLVADGAETKNDPPVRPGGYL